MHIITSKNPIFFKASLPKNYKKIDDCVSRSAQPTEEEIEWLKDNKVTDIFNFRTMHVPAIDFNEENVCKKHNINYYQFPLTEKQLNKGDESELVPRIKTIFDKVEQIKKSGGKIHWHCKAGADRTGFISLLYKETQGIDSFEKNTQEMIDMGYHQKLYPNLTNTARKILNFLK